MPVPPRPHRSCTISWARRHVDEDDRRALDFLIYRSQRTAGEVADLISEEVIDCDYQTIQRHRNGRCRTCKREGTDHGSTLGTTGDTDRAGGET